VHLSGCARVGADERKGRTFERMAYIITEPCVGVKDAACVEVCPVDCIYAKDEDDMYYIHPDECIDCGACVLEFPVNAILEEPETPEEWKNYIAINADYFNK